jgi:DNA polymerase-3 subunit delta'
MAFEWHKEILTRLLNKRDSLPHALLLKGPEGIGKAEFALSLAAGLLCQKAGESRWACGDCHACHLIAAGTHPDLMPVGLEIVDDKQAKEIKVDQIRELNARLSQTSQFGGFKVAIIDPADRMNRNAANSLLKTLEEPPAGTLILLISAHASLLPATVRSRCQSLKLPAPDRESTLAWLKQRFPELDGLALLAAGDGAPKTAAKLAEAGLLPERRAQFATLKSIADRRHSPIQAAAQWSLKSCPVTPPQLLHWWSGWVGDLVRLKMLEAGHQQPQSADLEQDLLAIAGRIDLKSLFMFRDRLQQAVRLLSGSANVQLLLEALLMNWEEITAGNTAK